MDRILKRSLAIGVLAGLTLLLPLAASAQTTADRWSYSLTPYLWLPSMKGDLNYGPPPAGGASPSVSVDSEKLLEALDAALMLEGTARYGRWLIGGDLMYVKFGGSPGAIRHVDFNPGTGPINIANTTANLGTSSTVEGTILTLVGGYELLQQPRAVLHVIGGLRYARFEASTNWNLSATIAGPGGSGLTFAQAGSVARSQSVTDAIIGVRGRFNLGAGNWFVPYYADIGTGDSDSTYQALLGIGYGYKWGDVVLTYRHLQYDMGSNKLLQDFELSGPALAVNFRF